MDKDVINKKLDQPFYLLIKIFVSLGLLGLIIFIAANISDLRNSPESILFSLIAFVISVAAVIMTTLQSLSIAQQVRITKKSAALVNETAEQVRKLIAADKLMEREIREDLEADQEIVKILEEVGVGDNEHERHAVAKRIQKIKNG